MSSQDVVIGPYKLGWHDEENYVFKPKKGLSEEIVLEMSAIKGEPEWMRNFRLKALKRFMAKPMAAWFASNMPDLNFDEIYYYIKPVEKQVNSWDQLPESVKVTYEKLGIPEAERKYLAGVTAQYECLPADSPILTDRGEIALKDLKAGDNVVCFTNDGRAKLSKVKGVKFSGIKPLLAIEASGLKIRASYNHPFLKLITKDDLISYKWVPAEELKVGDYIATINNVANLLKQFGESHSAQEAKFYYYLGLLDSKKAQLEKQATSFGIRLLNQGSKFIELTEAQFNDLMAKHQIQKVHLKETLVSLAKSYWFAYLEGYLSNNVDKTNAIVEFIKTNLVSFKEADSGITYNDLKFVQINEIIKSNKEEVFDIEVDTYHNFVAAGFIVHNSEVVYHKNREDLEKMGVIFLDMDSAVKKHPDLVQRYFGTVIPPGDNKFAALNSAVWSGGSFIYVPPGVKVEMPLQAYFRINAENMGQFERTLIIADEGSSVHYVEGCSAPIYSSDSLHSAVVELIAHEGARITYTTIQNWSTNVYNLVTKRARADAYARVEWIDGNIGSRLTMKYPSVFLMGPKASGEVLSVAYAGKAQHQDAGAKMHHVAPETSSTIISKSISKDGGKTTYRGKVEVQEGAKGAKSYVRCDALILDEDSISETKPTMEIKERDASIGHEATVAKISDEALYYLMSRGLSESQAISMIVNGFIEPVTKTLPMEYAVEWSRLIELQMEGSIG
jgi:Fe-S cluster assembly protein SufB